MGHKKEKPKIGRPPLDDSERRSKVVKARVTPAEYRQIEQAAAPKTVSEFARQALLRASSKH